MTEHSKNINWIETIGLITVVVSLVFVGAELRQNTAAVQASTTQEISNASREFVLEIALSEELTEIRRKGAVADDLTPSEQTRFNAIVLGNWIFFQNVWIQWDLGVVDERVWLSYVRIFCGQLNFVGTRTTWEQQRPLYDSGFIEFVYANCPIYKGENVDA